MKITDKVSLFLLFLKLLSEPQREILLFARRDEIEASFHFHDRSFVEKSKRNFSEAISSTIRSIDRNSGRTKEFDRVILVSATCLVSSQVDEDSKLAFLVIVRRQISTSE